MKLKLLYIVSFMITLSFPCILFSQTVEEIIEKHIEAHGGAENWNKVDALKVTAKFTAFSLEKDFSCVKTKDGSYFANLYLGEVNVIEAFDGKSGWTIDPWQEIYHARKLNSIEDNVVLQKAEYFTPFYNYQEKGHVVEYTGKEMIDGIEMFALKLTRENGHIETWYLNTETYLEYLCTSDWVDFAYPAPSEVYFDDFRTVEGLVLPFFTDRTFWQRSRILQIEHIEINPVIDKDLFAMPSREEMKKLDFLIGDWDVNVKTWTPRGSWYDLGNTTSSFHLASPNMLQENIAYERIFLFSKVISYTYNDSRDNYRISEYNELSTSMNVYEGNFSDTAFIYDNTKVIFGDTLSAATGHFQYSIYNMENDGFVIERKRSPDNGTTWEPGDKFTYTRSEEKD